MNASLITKNGKLISISATFNFPHGDRRFGEMVANLKSLPDYHWIPEEKHWRIGLSLPSAKKLQKWGFRFSEDLQKWFEELTKPVDEKFTDKFQLDPRLYPFQRAGVAFIESRKGRALIGDEMGLGKTAQAVTWLKIHLEIRPVIVVCPASVKEMWRRELRLWGLEKEKIQIISGRVNGDSDIWGQIIIVNYDILPNQTSKETKKEIPNTGWVDIISKMNPKALILDEVHYTKSSKALRTKAAKHLARRSPHVLALSGTPIVN